jgi:PAS domain S-box-containing protein
MCDEKSEARLRPENAELNRQIALLEETLREKTLTGEALQDSEKRYRRLFESAKDGILILDAASGRVVDVNPFLLNLLGYSYDGLIGQFIWELGVFKDIAASKEAFQSLQDNEYIRYDDLPLETLSGKPIAVEFVSNVYLVDHSKVIQCNIRDITERKSADAERKRLMAAVEQSGEIIFMTDIRGNIQYVNPAFERTTGYSREDVEGQNPSILKSGKQDEDFYRNLWKTISGGGIWEGRMINQRKDKLLYTSDAMISPVRDHSGRIVNYVGIERDVTAHLQLSAQFQQAQKMEAVGLLAGGVAHDYNNMLSAIIGYAELCLLKVDPTQSIYSDLTEIIKAARRSANITRQLLTFARKQTILPEVLDLNQTVESTLKMLKRLIGEDIHLDWRPTGTPCLVKMDPVQVDQILVNLCVNARDAIADVGKIIIETGNAVFDETYGNTHFGFVKGDYVFLEISDDGCGIDKETIKQIFEPFFTSKKVGKGTGLGLSMVHGIVQQNNGFINVYSEPGKGTTLKIYLPRFVGQAGQTRLKKEIVSVGHGETVLVVEDEPALLTMDKRMLERLGYKVLAAGTPGEAIMLAEENAGDLHLVITDVVMPEMNGRDLVVRLRSLCPNLKIMFMSGYTADVIASRGVLDESINFIQKPFSIQELAVKVQKVLKEK